MIYDKKTRKLISLINNLDDIPHEKYLDSELLIWFIDNVIYEPTDCHILYFVTQEPEYKMWKILSEFLSNKIYLDLFSFETRYGIYKDLKLWLIDAIKRNYIAEL